MYKILIVDDDMLIRKGIRNVIRWKDFDCEICAEASTGEEALELIKKFTPDIVITDIRMPNMDGIELIERIKAILPQCKIIILTAYREFEYAQRAIKFGAFDFLLKPTKVEDIINVVQKAIAEINKEKTMIEELEKINRLLQEKLPILRENFLFNVIFEMITNEDEIVQMAEVYKIDIKNFVMILAECGIKEENEKPNSHLYLLGVSNILNDFIDKDCSIYTIYLNNSQAVYVVSFECEPSKKEELEFFELLKQLKKAAIECFNIDLTLVVSTWGYGIVELPNKFKECIDAINYKFYFDNEDIIYYKDLSHLFVYVDDKKLKYLKNEIISNVRYGNISNIDILLSELEETLKKSKADKQYIFNLYYLMLIEINMIKAQVLSSSSQYEQEDKLQDIEFLSEILKCKSISELNGVLKMSIQKTIEEVQKHNQSKMGSLIKKVIEYIKANYSYNEISLSEISEKFFVSPSYLSRLFKKETGKNLSDFINEYRIEKAKELLATTDLKTYEVADKVGIPDPHYFSRIFKRYTGYSPSEYKEIVKFKNVRLNG
ncbi:response regulator receiver protein [Caldicellulosiruptor saccharolyticus DSM 8903]|uniref:Response regulator receiver protein n=1 Tax=Caldicellulosiruptor saccharolyticus (strain ATCC 43494 / DSM 8903 / Tp8T 6331) TaxID=351627 RepID=A4XHB8_CALS8|nr:response regulator transcription factor [Caldicellulosiruptor saccharolyticus]ABP66303.1 response regulator receiver protein [Caldicellulosiruptor saccharolyticus DSM 8903]